MIATLNIGLNVGNQKNVIAGDYVLVALGHLGVEPIDSRELESDTENTLVVRIHRPLSAQEGHALAIVLRQEAITQYTAANNKGQSFGPQSGRWKFDGRYFILIDGSRLIPAQEYNRRVVWQRRYRNKHAGHDYTGTNRRHAVIDRRQGRTVVQS